MTFYKIRRRARYRIAALLAAFVAVFGGLAVLNPAPASAYCTFGQSFSHCYLVSGAQDPGTYDVGFQVKCSLSYQINYDWGTMQLWEAFHSNVWWSSDGFIDPKPPYPNAYYNPCSNSQGSGIVAIKLDGIQTGIGQIMCRSRDGYADYWPGATWVKVSHDDGTWRNFPTAKNPMHRLECKTTLR